MSVTRKDIENVALLARIQITEADITSTTDSINQVLGLVDQLRDANTEGVEPMAHPLDLKQRLRADLVTEPNQREVLQSNAPQVEEGLFLVPKVIE